MSVEGDRERGTGSDSEIILPEFSSVDDRTGQISKRYSEMIPQRASSIANIDDTVLEVKIKEEVEVSDIFMRRSIDGENYETVFLTGLHDQPERTSDSRTETHLLCYTQVDNHLRGTPSYLQISTPKSSIIPTNHSEIEFVQQSIQPKPSEDTRLSARLRTSRNSLPNEPLEISPPNASNDAQPATNVTHTNHFMCVLCEMNFPTFVERNDHVLAVHEHYLCSHTKQKYCHRFLCHVNIFIPCLERQRKYLVNETPEQRTNRLAKHAYRKKRRLANETPEQRKARLAVRREQYRKRVAKETFEQTKARLPRREEPQMNYLADESTEHSTGRLAATGASDFSQCEYGEKIYGLECDRKTHVDSLQGKTFHL